MKLTDEVSVVVPAPPARVWALLADLPRMGEWSPECTGCTWDDPGAPFGPGRTFVGHNRWGLLRWTTRGELEVCEVDRELVYVTGRGGRPLTRWSYRLEPVEGGTRVTESYESLETPTVMLAVERLLGRPARLRRGMGETLDRLSVAAARGQGRQES
ncbi:MAG: SRPBCC family protein [Acidimicrobiia bacterium]